MILRILIQQKTRINPHMGFSEHGLPAIFSGFIIIAPMINGHVLEYSPCLVKGKNHIKLIISSYPLFPYG